KRVEHKTSRILDEIDDIDELNLILQDATPEELELLDERMKMEKGKSLRAILEEAEEKRKNAWWRPFAVIGAMLLSVIPGVGPILTTLELLPHNNDLNADPETMSTLGRVKGATAGALDPPDESRVSAAMETLEDELGAWFYTNDSAVLSALRG